uniref:Knottin scorpion toxin-like domain-containing protein n=2 Tax=Aegilops tauschii TaxID=37682 RepID=A0A453J718_AEGTS
MTTTKVVFLGLVLSVLCLGVMSKERIDDGSYVPQGCDIHVVSKSCPSKDACMTLCKKTYHSDKVYGECVPEGCHCIVCVISAGN